MATETRTESPQKPTAAITRQQVEHRCGHIEETAVWTDDGKQKQQMRAIAMNGMCSVCSGGKGRK